MPYINGILGTSAANTAVITDSVTCTTSRLPVQQHNQFPLQNTGLHVPTHFQIPPLTQPPPPRIEPNTHPPHTGNGQQHQNFPPNYNPVTGQFLPLPDQLSRQQPGVNFRMQQHENDRNERLQQLGGVSYYADAVLKGPRLEIPLFEGEDPIGWLQQCEKFFDMSGTPYEQWVNIATGHFYGRANVWLKTYVSHGK
jgi:hypothetical protein